MRGLMKFGLFGNCLVLAVSLFISSASAKHYEAVEYYEQNSKPVEEKKFKLVTYKPLSQKECTALKGKTGVAYCPTDNDYLAGAALACGGTWNMPDDKHLKKLAQRLYTVIKQEGNTTYFGVRNDKLMKKQNIYFNDEHLFFWTMQETSEDDNKGGFVRMFGIYGAAPYYILRDGTFVFKDLLHFDDEDYVLSIKSTADGETERYRETDIPPLKQKNKNKLVTLCYDTEKD